MKLLSCVRLSATPWTVAYQAPQSMEFSRQEYWSGLPFPSPGDLPNPGMEPGSPTLQAGALPSEPPGKTKDLVLRVSPSSTGLPSTVKEWKKRRGHTRIVSKTLPRRLEGILNLNSAARGPGPHTRGPFCATSLLPPGYQGTHHPRVRLAHTEAGRTSHSCCCSTEPPVGIFLALFSAMFIKRIHFIDFNVNKRLFILSIFKNRE